MRKSIEQKAKPKHYAAKASAVYRGWLAIDHSVTDDHENSSGAYLDCSGNFGRFSISLIGYEKVCRLCHNCVICKNPSFKIPLYRLIIMSQGRNRDF